MSVESTEFKEAMRGWASGVTVITTVNDGKWKGMTASAFSSISAEPPLVLICVKGSLYTRELIDASGVFAVNVLAEDQIELGKLFAGMYPEIEDRFAGKNCLTAETGAPIFEGVMSWFDCKVKISYEEGDHIIFIGDVVACGVSDPIAEPLLYHNRQWGQFSST